MRRVRLEVTRGCGATAGGGGHIRDLVRHKSNLEALTAAGYGDGCMIDQVDHRWLCKVSKAAGGLRC